MESNHNLKKGQKEEKKEGEEENLLPFVLMAVGRECANTDDHGGSQEHRIRM